MSWLQQSQLQRLFYIFPLNNWLYVLNERNVSYAAKCCVDTVWEGIRIHTAV